MKKNLNRNDVRKLKYIKDTIVSCLEKIRNSEDAKVRAYYVRYVNDLIAYRHSVLKIKIA